MNCDAALGTILSTLSLDISQQFSDTDDLETVWKTLKEKYDKIDTQQLAVLE